MKKYFVLTCLITFIAIGLFLRFNVFGNDLLWSDEAETTINTMQVLDHGYPSDSYKGKPLYENDSFITQNDPKYALASTNYHGTRFERNKGWLTFYYQAIFIKLFGANTIVYRLPFILLFPFSLILLFLLTKKLFDEKVGLLASALYSFSYYSFFYEGQARYYSLTIFLSLFCAYYFYLAITKQNAKYYILSALGLLLLFYTHILTFIVLVIFFLAGHILYYHKLKCLLSKKIIIPLLALIPLTIPWLILVKIWEINQVYQSSKFKILWLILIIGTISVWWLAEQIFPQIKNIFRNKLNGINYLITYLGCIIFLKPIIAPWESISARLLIESTPIIYVLFSAICMTILKNKKITLISLAGLILLTLIFYTISVPFKNSPNTYQTAWVQQTIDYLREKNIDENTLILVPYQQLPLLLYTNYNVEVIWPLRKSYVDNYPGEILFIYNKYQFWPKYTNGIIKEDKSIDFGSRTNHCQEQHINVNTYLINCPALN